MSRKSSSASVKAGSRKASAVSITRPLKGDRDYDAYEDVEETKYEIKTQRSGVINVFVQGKIESIGMTTPVFMTVHDIGENHTGYHKFVEAPCMAKIKARSVFIHVELPGQEFDAPDLAESFQFPSIQDFAEDLIYVLDFFSIKYCVTLGEGAGANIVTRFSMAHPERVLGNVLIHCNAGVAGVFQYLNDKIVSWKLGAMGMNASAEEYLVFHKFGTAMLKLLPFNLPVDQHHRVHWMSVIKQQLEKEQDKDRVVQDYIKRLERRMNPHNLRLYVNSFLNRSDLSHELRERMKVDTLLVSGSRPSHAAMVDGMQACMDPKITTRVKIDDCGDVLDDAPDTFAYDMLLFCQGLGLFSALPISRHGSIC